MPKHRWVFSLTLVLCSLLVFDAFDAQGFSPKEIYQKNGPGVVFIFASAGAAQGSGGTGSIIRSDGLVITNAHLFKTDDAARPASNIAVFLKPHRLSGNPKKDLARSYPGEIVAYDPALDLALVRMRDVDVPLVTIAFADSADIEVGERVFAIGHPEQGGLWSLTSGVISAYWENYGGVPGKHLFQTDASINRGNSGGPLLDERGLMIGINSMIARKADDGLTITDVNFSIKSNVAVAWLNRQGFAFIAVRPAQGDARPPAAATTAEPAAPPPPAPLEKPVAAPEAAPPLKTGTPGTPPAPRVEPPARPPQALAPPPSSASPAPAAPGPQGDSTRLLTPPKPYDMDRLLEGMREMEEMMDEMKSFIDDFKQRRKP